MQLEGPTLVLSFCEGVTFARVRRLQQENHTICRIHTAHLVASFASANDDEDEELVSKAKANRQKRIVEEKDTEQDFAKSAGYNGVTLLTIERGVKKLAKSGSDLEAGNLTSVAKLVR